MNGVVITVIMGLKGIEKEGQNWQLPSWGGGGGGGGGG
jgi:hypothetical protein